MAPGRILLAIALLGFGIENILFGRYIVARVAPWSADPSVRFAVACLTGAVFLGSSAALLSGRFTRPAALASAGLILGWSLWRHLPVAVAGPAWSGDWTNVVKAATLAAVMVFSWVFLVHVPLVFSVGRAEWMGVFEALGISGVCLALATARAPVPRTVGTPAPIS